MKLLTTLIVDICIDENTMIIEKKERILKIVKILAIIELENKIDNYITNKM